MSECRLISRKLVEKNIVIGENEEPERKRLDSSDR